MHTQIAQTTLHPTIALFIVLSPPRQLIMLAQADNDPSVERQLYKLRRINKIKQSEEIKWCDNRGW